MTCSPEVQKSAITALASAASCLGEAFQVYTAQVLPGLYRYLTITDVSPSATALCSWTLCLLLVLLPRQRYVQQSNLPCFAAQHRFEMSLH